MKVKEESEKVGLKLNIRTTKIMASGPITSWQIDGETVEIVDDFIFWSSKITADDDCSHEIKRCLLLGRRVTANLVQFTSITKLCKTLCDPMNHSIPRLPVHHQLPESTKTHVHWVDDAIQPSHPMSSHSPPAHNLSQHQVFSNETASGGQSTGVSASTSVLQHQHPGLISLGWTGWISLLANGLSRVFSNTTNQKHKFFSAQFSL